MHKEKQNFVVDRNNLRVATNFPHTLSKAVHFWITENSSLNLLPNGALKY